MSVYKHAAEGPRDNLCTCDQRYDASDDILTCITVRDWINFCDSYTNRTKDGLLSFYFCGLLLCGFQVSAFMSDSGESEPVRKPVCYVGRTSQHPDVPQRGGSTFDHPEPSRYVSVCGSVVAGEQS